jgi:hypothetical protein
MQLSIIVEIGATIARVHSHHGLMSPDWRREQFERLSTDASVSTRKRPGFREELTVPAKPRESLSRKPGIRESE